MAKWRCNNGCCKGLDDEAHTIVMKEALYGPDCLPFERVPDDGDKLKRAEVIWPEEGYDG